MQTLSRIFMQNNKDSSPCESVGTRLYTHDLMGSFSQRTFGLREVKCLTRGGSPRMQTRVPNCSTSPPPSYRTPGPGGVSSNQLKVLTYTTMV